MPEGEAALLRRTTAAIARRPGRVLTASLLVLAACGSGDGGGEAETSVPTTEATPTTVVDTTTTTEAPEATTTLPSTTIAPSTSEAPTTTEAQVEWAEGYRGEQGNPADVIPEPAFQEHNVQEMFVDLFSGTLTGQARFDGDGPQEYGDAVFDVRVGTSGFVGGFPLRFPAAIVQDMAEITDTYPILFDPDFTDQEDLDTTSVVENLASGTEEGETAALFSIFGDREPFGRYDDPTNAGEFHDGRPPVLQLQVAFPDAFIQYLPEGFVADGQTPEETFLGINTFLVGDGEPFIDFDDVPVAHMPFVVSVEEDARVADDPLIHGIPESERDDF